MEIDMSTAIAWLFPRMSLSSVADLDTLASIILFCGAGLVLSLSVLLLDQYIPGEWF
jgi:uncharacterized MnhB-related membrane protein